MSNKRVPATYLVVDASIARAAGSVESSDPKGSVCRQFLQTIRAEDRLHMAINSKIAAEWDRHQSNFARSWRVAMMKIKKIRPLRDDDWNEFREAIQDHSEDENIVEIMLKDAHLIEAAVDSDRRVASLDDKVRGHFGRMSSTFKEIRAVLWVNPAMEGEKCEKWLKNGAPNERKRHLGA